MINFFLSNEDIEEDPIFWKEQDRKIEREFNKERKNSASTPKRISAKALMKYLVYGTGDLPQRYKDKNIKVNDKIDTVSKSGVIFDRYLRRCLCCDEMFIGYGQFKRSCYNCKRQFRKRLNSGQQD